MEHFPNAESHEQPNIEEIIQKVLKPVKSPTESEPDRTAPPGMSAMQRRLEEYSPEMQTVILQSPEVIQAIVEYVTEPGKPLRLRIEGLPEEIREVVNNDPRVQEALSE
jgi:hypothetical protein